MEKYDEQNLEDEVCAGSLVYRVEDLLAGKDFEELKRLSDCYFEFYDKMFGDTIEDLNNYEKALLPTEKEEEYQKYLHDKWLLSVPVGHLTNNQRKHILKLYHKTFYNIESNMSMLTAVPNKNRVVAEHLTKILLQKEYSAVSYAQSMLKHAMNLPPLAKVRRHRRSYFLQKKLNKSAHDQKFCFAVDKDVLFGNSAEIIAALERIKQKYPERKLELVIDSNKFQDVETNDFDTRVPYFFTDSELKLLRDLKSRKINLKAKNQAETTLLCAMFISEFYTENYMPCNRYQLWNIKDLLNVYDEDVLLDKNIIKTKGLTPFEAVLYINDAMSHLLPMNQSSGQEGPRTFVTMERTKANVARKSMMNLNLGMSNTGFATYIKALIDKLDDENLRCKLINVSPYNERLPLKRTYSVLNYLLIKLKDEKYGVDGYYLWDPMNRQFRDGLERVLFPISDINNGLWKINIVDEDINLPKISKYLYVPSNMILKYELKQSPNEEFLKKYAGLSNPIPLFTFQSGLKNLYEKVISEKRHQSTSDLYFYKSADEFAEVIIYKTLKCLKNFSNVNASSDFYRVMRNFFANNIEKYPDFQHNWKKYLEVLYCNENGDPASSFDEDMMQNEAGEFGEDYSDFDWDEGEFSKKLAVLHDDEGELDGEDESEPDEDNRYMKI